jgi:antagonist of KipI
MPIHVKSPGPLTTFQDLGRYGYSHLGISPAGAADQVSFRVANLLVGNNENAPALEMTMIGATLEFEERAIVAITGAECDCKLGADAVPNKTAIEIPPGGVLRCGGMRTGVRAYLAVQGGFDVRQVMGSASTHIGGRFGGLDGRKLKVGDELRVRLHGGKQRTLKHSALDALFGTTIRVTRGSQQEWFGPEAYDRLFSRAYSVSEQSDRTGLRLKGEPMRPREQAQLITDGNPLGGIQVPQDGQPIVLFVDQQTTGGYPKIASVIMADMHRVGQLRPRDEVRFAEVTIPQAIELLRQQEQLLRDVLAVSRVSAR